MFSPKKKIPSLAAAGLALAGCGDGGANSELDAARDRIAQLDPSVTAFCMREIECDPYPEDPFFGDVDNCRTLILQLYGDYIQGSPDPDACGAAFIAAFDCAGDTPCDDILYACEVEYDATLAVCGDDEEELTP
jgi:hypothetical protein